jgi:glyoxylase-like metal-dependent hydrolase (beta-lactamase superfamily II)
MRLEHDHVELPVVDNWFWRRRIDDRVTLLVEPFVDRLVQCNIWHVRGRDRDLLVDTGLGIVSLRAAAADLFEHRLLAVATHFHYDHTGSLHEFDQRAIHRAEAAVIAQPGGIGGGLVVADIPDDVRQAIVDGGYPLDDELLVNALPVPGYDPGAYEVPACAATIVLDEGDIVDLGDVAFEVLHLPGHSPGSIGLWDATNGMLFSGDALYDGPLLDEVPGADIEAYVRTMERLRELPVEVVHAGHDPSFGRDRLVELTTAYLERRAPTGAQPIGRPLETSSGG